MLQSAESRILCILWLCLGATISCDRPDAPEPSVTDEPVVEADIEANVDRWRIRLKWTTETEKNSFGYFVYRADLEGAEPVCINADDPLHATGTSHMPQNYVYYDLDVVGETTYYYRVQAVDLDGSKEWIVGHPDPAPGRAKPLKPEEAEEIEARGSMWREEG